MMQEDMAPQQDPNEWILNETLLALFKTSRDFFPLHQDPELQLYVGRVLMPLAQLKYGQRNVSGASLETQRGTKISIFYKKFKTDAVVITKNGQAHIVETKIVNVNSVTSCNNLVLQVLVYADLLISPRWYRSSIPADGKPLTTYDLLADLHEAHWHLRVYGEAKYRGVEYWHQKFFNLEEPLSKEDFCQLPGILFVLPDFNHENLTEACHRVKNMTFSEFKAYISETPTRNSSFFRRIDYLESNWPKLQQLNFSHLKLNLKDFTTIIEFTPNPLG